MSAAPAAPALVIESASVAYRRGTPVVEAVSGVLRAGTAVALVGPNGAGKSTLINAILGVVPLTAGRIEVLGTRPARARREVGCVPQADTLDADFPIDVRQVVMMGRYRSLGLLRRASTADHAIVRDALDRVGLMSRARDRFGTLSGGQRQRVLLARAFAARPRLLLLDEPFNGIDATSRQSLLDALGWFKSRGCAVLVSTHDLSVAQLICEQVCLLNRRQYGFGPTAEMLTAGRLGEVYGGAVITSADGAAVAQP